MPIQIRFGSFVREITIHQDRISYPAKAHLNLVLQIAFMLGIGVTFAEPEIIERLTLSKAK